LNIEIGTKLKKRIRREWQKKYNLTKHKKTHIHLKRIMAANVLLKWIKIYKNNKSQKSLLSDRKVDMLEQKLTKNLVHEIIELKSEQQNEVDYFENEEEKEEKKAMTNTEECSKINDDFVKNNQNNFLL
jgi:hypothetical protein